MLYSRIVLGLGVLMFAVLGLILLFKPEKLEAWVGIAAQTPEARTELRAWYGGLEVALAAFLVLGMFRPEIAPVACLVLALISIGPLCGRLIGFVADGSASASMWSIAAIEVTFVVLGWIGWMRGVPKELG